jgi:hypothetical protein
VKKEIKKNAPFKVRVPGFLVEGEIGLGDLIKRTTSAIGFMPCSSCEKRALQLNGWVVFTNGKNIKPK